MSNSYARALVAEAIGTFALVFAGCGAIMVDAKTHALGHVGVAFCFGLVIMVMIYAVGHVSGAHFNGAVTFAFAVTRHFPWSRAVGYWAAQLVGALAAASPTARVSVATARITNIRNALSTSSQRNDWPWDPDGRVAPTWAMFPSELRRSAAAARAPVSCAAQ